MTVNVDYENYMFGVFEQIRAGSLSNKAALKMVNNAVNNQGPWHTLKAAHERWGGYKPETIRKNYATDPKLKKYFQKIGKTWMVHETFYTSRL